jgi:nicotinamide mononucleotide transporter
VKSKLNLLHLTGVVLVSVGTGLLFRLIYHTEWWEFAAYVTGVVAVYLAAVEHIVNWPVGIVNVVLYAWVFYVGNLKADFTLQFFYLALSIQGWWQWSRGGAAKKELSITRIQPISWLIIAGLWVAGTAIYTPVIRHFNSSYVLADTSLAVGSVIAQIMLNFKKLENWILWIVIDGCYVPLYWTKHLQATAFLYAFFMILAVYGLINWIKNPSGQATSPGAFSEEFSQRL